MIREFITRINRSLSERRASSRRQHKAPIKIWFDPETNTERARDDAKTAFLMGETVDISRTGIAFLVPSIRVKEKYLVGQGRNLNVEIDLPGGKIQMRVMGSRYEKVGIHVSMERYFIGAQIVTLLGADKENYEFFLSNGNQNTKSAAAGLEMETD